MQFLPLGVYENIEEKIDLLTFYPQVDACGKIMSHVGKSLNYMELIPDREKHTGLLKALKEFDANNDGILEGKGKTLLANLSVFKNRRRVWFGVIEFQFLNLRPILLFFYFFS